VEGQEMVSIPPVSGTPDLAFYYPAFMWHNSDWVKNIVLFVDGIALLVPAYMHDRPYRFDPAIATGRQEHNLLTILEPESFIDQQSAELLVSQLTDLIASGSLDAIANDKVPFGELSYSRLGGMADPGLANMIIEELEKRHLARPTEDGVSIPVHPRVHSLVLVLLAQILRAPGKARGLNLHPATDRPHDHEAIKEILQLPALPSTGHVVSLDLQTVGVDLGPVPLDEVLDFRRENGIKYRRYAQNLRELVQRISSAPAEDQQEALRLRQQQIRDASEELAQAAEQAWRRPLTLFLGIAGAFWSIMAGDPIGGFLSAGTAIAEASQSGPAEAGAYSYLFTANALLSTAS
jgi:hypothetical protein